MQRSITGDHDAHPPFHPRIPRRNPIEQAGWTLAFVAAAIIGPALLRWVLGSVAAAGAGQAGYPAEAARMAWTPRGCW